jgi:hypothetical protein
MSDDLELRLRQVTPGAPPELRRRVLAAVAVELNSVRRPRRPLRRVLAVAVAAAVLVSLAMNYVVSDSIDRRLAVVLGPRPVRRDAAEIAADIAAVTDATTGRWAYERLASDQAHDFDALRYAVRLRQVIEQLTVDLEEIIDETPRTNPQVGRDRRGSRDRRPADDQYVLRLEHRNTARAAPQNAARCG